MIEWKKGLIISLGLIIVAALVGTSLFTKIQRNNTPIKVLVIFQEDEGKILLEKFQQTTGQSYEIIRMSSGEANYNLLSINQMQVDVILGGPADLHEQLKKSNKLLKYIPKNSDDIPEQYKDPDKYWTGMYMGPLAIGINTEVWSKDEQLRNLPYPTSYEDLLIPELKGKIDLPNPETSGTGYTLLASLTQEKSEEEAIELMQKLTKQSKSTTFSGIASAQRLATGEVTVALSFLGDQLRFRNSGYAIISKIPEQAGWEIGAVSIVKNTSHKKVAKQLVEFVLDKEAQTYYTNTAFSYPVNQHVEVNELLSTVDMNNILQNYSFAMAADNRHSLIEKYRVK